VVPGAGSDGGPGQGCLPAAPGGPGVPRLVVAQGEGGLAGIWAGLTDRERRQMRAIG
jgi:hypothetical protein